MYVNIIIILFMLSLLKKDKVAFVFENKLERDDVEGLVNGYSL